MEKIRVEDSCLLPATAILAKSWRAHKLEWKAHEGLTPENATNSVSVLDRLVVGFSLPLPSTLMAFQGMLASYSEVTDRCLPVN